MCRSPKMKYIWCFSVLSRPDFVDTPIPPCGACRQVLLETEKRYGKPMRILLYSKTDIYILENVSGLLPLSFDGNYLK